jgi:hypothetical protein
VMSIVLEVSLKDIYGNGASGDGGDGGAGGDASVPPLPLLAIGGVTSRVFFASDGGPDGEAKSKDGGAGK